MQIIRLGLIIIARALIFIGKDSKIKPRGTNFMGTGTSIEGKNTLTVKNFNKLPKTGTVHRTSMLD